MDQKTNYNGNYKIFLLKDNKNAIKHNLWDAAKGVLRRKLIALNAYIRK